MRVGRKGEGRNVNEQFCCDCRYVFLAPTEEPCATCLRERNGPSWTRPKFELKTDAYPLPVAVTAEPERITPLVYLVGQIVSAYGDLVLSLDSESAISITNAAELLLAEIKKREAAK